MRSFAVVLPLLAFMPACSTQPPPHWAEGGARFVTENATWTTGEGTLVQLTKDGKVIADGDHVFTIDSAGRVYDKDNEPAAIVLPDGNVAGTDDTHLGRIGLSNAAPPGGGAAWLSVFPNGEVIHYDPDGQRSTDGAWRGCTGPVLRTCTLVSHLYTLERISRASGGGGFTFGVGVGVVL
jgi:hypothetical protein